MPKINSLISTVSFLFTILATQQGCFPLLDDCPIYGKAPADSQCAKKMKKKTGSNHDEQLPEAEITPMGPDWAYPETGFKSLSVESELPGFWYQNHCKDHESADETGIKSKQLILNVKQIEHRYYQYSAGELRFENASCNGQGQVHLLEGGYLTISDHDLGLNYPQIELSSLKAEVRTDEESDIFESLTSSFILAEDKLQALVKGKPVNFSRKMNPACYEKTVTKIKCNQNDEESIDLVPNYYFDSKENICRSGLVYPDVCPPTGSEENKYNHFNSVESCEMSCIEKSVLNTDLSLMAL